MLKRLRETAMLSQELLAERARISTRTVSDLERGVNKTARRFTADLLATALELEGDLRNVFLVAASGRPVPHETAGVSSDPAGDRLIGRETELRGWAAFSRQARAGSPWSGQAEWARPDWPRSSRNGTADSGRRLPCGSISRVSITRRSSSLTSRRRSR